MKTSSDLTLGVDGDEPLKREQLHFVFESQKLKGLLVLDLSIVEDLKESKRNISVKFLSSLAILKNFENWLEIIRVKVGNGRNMGELLRASADEAMKNLQELREFVQTPKSRNSGEGTQPSSK